MSFSNGNEAGFQGFCQLACLVTATVLRLELGSFRFLLRQGFYGMGLSRAGSHLGSLLISPLLTNSVVPLEKSESKTSS